ncbi:hypothetical protein QN277_010600 [Acacia crassicarpa]|uniref:PHD finger protein ALFIN-LIKE n=1 Tax=Acacia crassicarpa TaxID=499986 RepID=A0AAE1IN61_9FABA|nr:hypothetical protein QN277_010600 [Acacia crassicarpa]
MASSPRTVGDIFKDYSARKDGILRALTDDVHDFYRLCDPGKKSLSLYGYVDKTWKVTVPTEGLLHDIPEPAVGINHSKELMPPNEWLSVVADLSDSWLLSVAFYRARLNPDEREQLFNLINTDPTVFEVVTKKNPLKDKATVESSSKPRAGAKRTSDRQVKSNPKVSDEGYKVEEDDQSGKPCGSCGGNKDSGEAWIECDMCMEWFHEKCVRIITSKFGILKQYKCPLFNVTGGRP